jgi:DMSO/TMAO reductase YedYZ molybdopterin-dependent catalytic subunit
VTGEWASPLEIPLWALNVHGALATERKFSYQDILAMAPSQVEATLDCTNGWYSRQQWQGPSLMDLLSNLGLRADSRYVRIKSATGYAATFALVETREILLATHVGGQPLDHWHGYPVRSVAPSWRGWYWVKWVNDVEVLTQPHLDLPGII